MTQEKINEEAEKRYPIKSLPAEFGAFCAGARWLAQFLSQKTVTQSALEIIELLNSKIK